MESNKQSEANVIRKYRRYLKLERNYSPNTIAAYENDLRHLFEFLAGRGLSPFDVTLNDMEDFAVMLHDKGMTAKSQSRILAGVRSFYRYLLLDGYLEVDPTELLESPHLPKHLPEYLTTGEVDRMEAAIDLTSAEGHRNKAIIEVLFSCGLRVSELTGLRMSGLFLEEGFLRVVGKGNKERLVPIAGTAVEQLKLWFAQRVQLKIKPGEEDYVFLNRRGAHLTRTMILIMVKRLAEAAGIRKTVSPHTLRHSFATALLKGGADLRVIQELMGHADIGTTEIYTHLDNDSLRRAVLEHHPRNMG